MLSLLVPAEAENADVVDTINVHAAVEGRFALSAAATAMASSASFFYFVIFVRSSRNIQQKHPAKHPAKHCIAEEVPAEGWLVEGQHVHPKGVQQKGIQQSIKQKAD